MNAMMIIPDAIITINHIFTPVLANFLPDFMSLMTDETAGTAGGGITGGGVGGKILGGIVIANSVA